MRRLFLLTCIMLLYTCNYAWADEVFLNDGQRYEGEIVKEDEKSVMLETSQGKMFINKSDILHVERYKPEAEHSGESHTMMGKITSFFKQLPKNNWYLVRVKFNKIHNTIFTRLEKNRIYRYVAEKRQIKRFKRDNYGFYNFAVYMILFILTVLFISGTKTIITFFLRHIYGVKSKYDV